MLDLPVVMALGVMVVPGDMDGKSLELVESRNDAVEALLQFRSAVFLLKQQLPL
jgi:hypothetical protein